MYQDTLLTGGRGAGQRGLGFARASLNSSCGFHLTDSDLETYIRRLPLPGKLMSMTVRPGVPDTSNAGVKQGHVLGFVHILRLCTIRVEK